MWRGIKSDADASVLRDTIALVERRAVTPIAA
jgi:hypothetical protein